HAVCRRNRAQSDHIFVGAEIAHHADGAHRQQHSESLRDVVVETGAANFLDEEFVREPQDIEPLTCERTRAANGKARTWKRMPTDESFRQIKLAAKRAHFVFE